jgi:hypothetical protein
VVAHAATRNVDQPSTRIVGHPLGGPLYGRGKQGFLYRILGRGEVPESTQHRTENLRRKFTQQLFV